MLSESLTSRLFNGLRITPEEKHLWLQRAFQQLNRDLSLAGHCFTIPDHDDPAFRLEALARWLHDVSPAQMQQFLYCIDLPETLPLDSPDEVALLCLRRALLKVWLRYHCKSGSSPLSDVI